MIQLLRFAIFFSIFSFSLSIFQPPLPPLPIDETISSEFGFNIDGSPDEEFQLNLSSNEKNSENSILVNSSENTTAPAAPTISSSSSFSSLSASPPSFSPSDLFTISSTILPSTVLSTSLSTDSSTTSSTSSKSPTTTTKPSIEESDEDIRVTIALPSEALETEAPARSNFFEIIDKIFTTPPTVSTTTSTTTLTTTNLSTSEVTQPTETFEKDSKLETSSSIPSTTTETIQKLSTTSSTIAMMRTTLTTRPTKSQTDVTPKILKVSKFNRKTLKGNLRKSPTTTISQIVVEAAPRRRTGRTRRLKFVMLNGTISRVFSRVHQNPDNIVTSTVSAVPPFASTDRKDNENLSTFNSTASFEQVEAFHKSSKFIKKNRISTVSRSSDSNKIEQFSKKTSSLGSLRRRLRHSGISHSKIHRTSI